MGSYFCPLMYELPNASAEVFDLKSWVGKADDWQPKAIVTLHGVAVNTNLQENEGKRAS